MRHEGDPTRTSLGSCERVAGALNGGQRGFGRLKDVGQGNPHQDAVNRVDLGAVAAGIHEEREASIPGARAAFRAVLPLQFAVGLNHPRRSQYKFLIRHGCQRHSC